jgi:hypothetical protein
MSIKNRLESVIRGWFPKEPSIPKGKLKVAEAKVSKPKPWWWKPLWIITIVGVLISSLVTIFLLNVPLIRAIGGLALSFICIGFAYYIRVRPSMRINRAVYILIGITPIGFGIWIVWSISGIGMWVTNTVGPFPSLIISWVVCLGIGALIGDRIGKKRDYMLPLSL